MKTIRFGIMGPGYIAPRFVEAVNLSHHGQVIAVASKTPGKAEKFAQTHEIALSFDNYFDIVRHPDVDVIYISTRHDDHYEHIMLALQHKKHVLVEKPMVLTKAQAEACFKFASVNKVFLMEAQKMLFLPLIKKVQKMVDQGVIGELRLIETSFSYADRFDFGHWMLSFEHGGGLYATASYGLQFSSVFAKSPIANITALASLYPNNADRYGIATILYENGILAHTRFGTDVETRNRAYLYGSKGYIQIDLFWKNDFAKLYLRNESPQDIHADTINDMVYEVQHVIDRIQDLALVSDIVTPELSIETADMIETIKKQITPKGSSKHV